MNRTMAGMFMRTAALAAALGVLAAAPASAQQPMGSWQAWLGCWSAGPTVGGIAPSALSPLVCIAPTADANTVEIATVSGDSVISSKRIDASGRELPLDIKGCTGSQRAQWSADGRRVYLRAVASCDGVMRTTSGIIAMSSSGEWLDVQGVAANGDEGVRVARYHDVGVSSAVPLSIANALRGRATATQGARFDAGATIGTTAVVEASRAVTPAVVEAWVMERGQIFALDAKELVRLADAGVPARVTDAMVAVSNPTVFALTRPDPNTESRDIRRDDAELLGRRVYVYMDPMYSPYGWGYYGYGYGRYGYSPYGYGGGYYGYGSPYYGYPGYVQPIVIVNPTAQTRGQAVKGRGYTQTPSSGTATPTPAREAERPASSSSSSGSSSSSSGSSSGSSSQPRSEPAPRTAHPKP